MGWGYSSTPSVRIVGGGGSGAVATAAIANGVVTGITFSNGGTGYTSAPRILVESPPFVPTTGIAISRLNVIQRVRVNHNYVLESSADLKIWTEVVPQFTAETEELVTEVIVYPDAKYFRIREVP